MSEIESLNLPEERLEKIKNAGDYPNYYNRKQVALMLNISTGRLSSRSDELPGYDLKIGVKIYWLPKTIIPVVQKMQTASKNN